MSENEKQSQEPELECGMCGRNGGPAVECDLCHGNPRFAQERHFTLSEERQGKNKKKDDKRYGAYGDVMPRVINLPGSTNPYGS